MRVGKVLAAVGVYCVGTAYSQQYAGDVIPNSLPNVPGSEITYFKIADTSGKNKNLTLINYYSHGKDTTKRIVEANIQRAVIFIHGLNRDPGTYMSNMLSALAQVKSDPNVNFNTVSIMCPYFPNGDDKNVGYPWNDGQKPGRGSNTSALVWSGSQWTAGGDSQYPYYNTGVSSYAAIDQVIRYYDNATLFPNLHQIVVAGHSAGAQAVQRYAAIGANLNTKVPVTYWIGNPNSYAWLSTDRPLSTASCPTYDVYREGYTNFSSYPMTYGTALVAQGRSAILANFNGKAINYARGTNDHGDDSSTCGPYTTGKDRNERFFEYIAAFPPSCFGSTASNCDTVDYVPVGHDAGAMMASSAGQARLFLDNFYGNGNKSYDFGYPRQQIGDDPYPDPSQNSTPPAVNTNTYAGGMTYYGCWSDGSPATLKNMTYQNSGNTIEMCTSACASGGYTIAGLENDQCFCGNSLGYAAVQVTESSCNTNCGGNANELCGGYIRLSIYSNGQPQVLTAPTTPANISGYNYLACYTEATSGRALSGKQTSTNSMTLEYCANFCSGYQYFGTEYASECYCGNSFAAGAKVASANDCSYTCAANATEYCGGSNRLTVYQNPNPVAVSSSASTGASTTATGSSPTGTAVACPGSDGTTVTSYGQNFTIECGIDHQGGDLTSVSVNSFQQCIDACSQNSKCVDVSLSGSACYLKSTLGAAINNSGIYGAKLVTSGTFSNIASTSAISTGASSTSVATTAMTTASMSTASTSTTSTSTSSGTQASAVSCPASDGTTVTSYGQNFTIECNVDHQGGDLSSLSVSSFQQCIDACSQNSQCVDVSLSGSACYLKSTLGAALTANGIYGARLLTVGSSSTTASTASSSASASTVTGSSSSSSVTSSTTSAASQTTAASCPASDGTTVVSNGKSFVIECGIDHQAGDLTSVSVNSFQQCIDVCAQNSQCVDVSLSGVACYLKSTLGAAFTRSNIYGARLVTSSSSSISSTSSSVATTSTSASSSSSAPVTSTSSSTSSQSASTSSSAASSSSTVSTSTSITPSSTTSSATPTGTPVSCPGSNSTLVSSTSNNATFLIECGIDHAGGDMGVFSVNSFQQCIDTCANTTGCVDVSLSGVACYLKKAVGNPVYNGVYGARLVNSTSTSTTANVAATTFSSVTTTLSPTSTASSA